MQIKDITIDDIRQGKNWKVQSPDSVRWQEILMEDLFISEAQDFEQEDMIVYSTIFVSDDGDTKPLVMIKRVQDLDYGGDYCELVDGKWQQVGLVPNPNAPFGEEYIANPLEQDDSFGSDGDYRAYHRDGFNKFAANL